MRGSEQKICEFCYIHFPLFALFDKKKKQKYEPITNNIKLYF